MGITLAVVAGVCIPPVFYIEFAYSKSTVFATYPYTATPGCLTVKGSSILGFELVIVIIIETFLLILTLIKAMKHYRELRLLSSTHRFSDVPYRDAILFYVYLLGVSLANLIVAITSPNDPAHAVATPQRVSHSILSARVLINLREAHAASMRGSMTTTDDNIQLDRLAFARTQASSDQGRTTGPP